MANQETEKTSKGPAGEDTSLVRKVVGFILFPLAIFPLLSLLTYDWHAISKLQIPAVSPTGNLIGVVGDTFAYYGYTVFGIGVWIIPVLCCFVGLMLILNRDIHPGRRTLCIGLFTVSFCCLIQLTSNSPAVKSVLDAVNIGNNAGGVIGFMVMDNFLSRFISPFGAGVIIVLIMTISLLFAIGLDNIRSGIWCLIAWITGSGSQESREEKKARKEAEKAEKEAQFQAAKEAAAAAKAEAEAEKARIREERERHEREQKEASDKAARYEQELAAYEAIRRAKEAAAIENGRALPTKAKQEESAPEIHAAEEPPVEDKGPYILPTPELLEPVPPAAEGENDVESVKEVILSTLRAYGVDATVTGAIQGPTVTQYAVTPNSATGTTMSNITARAKELQGAMMVESMRVFSPIPGKNAVGIEVPNRTPSAVHFRSVIESATWKAASKNMQLPLLLGRDISGRELVADLTKLPHLLVAGATGKGKSVCLNSIICGLLMSRTPEQLKFIMVDPKRVEFSCYNKLPHLLIPVVNENAKVVFALKWAVKQMSDRLKIFQKVNAKNIVAFNNRATQSDLFGENNDESIPKTIPYIIIIIDEVADIMQTSGRDVEPVIARLAALARATGIHLILATQRPDTKVITGTIKGNITGRIAFKTSSSIDSRTILDTIGAEQLIGMGDMLYKQADGNLIRAQGSLIQESDIATILSFIAAHSNVQFDEKLNERISKINDQEEDELDGDSGKQESESQQGMFPAESSNGGMRPAGMSNSKEEELYNRALETVRLTKRASTSHLQRRLGIGYNHAARIMDLLEDRGIIGPAKGGSAVREILVDLDQMLGIGAVTQPDQQEMQAEQQVSSTDNNEEQIWTLEQPSEPPANQNI